MNQSLDQSAGRRRFHYHLRFQILPGPRAKADARSLAAFCRTHGIEEAVLFFAAEEWNNGLLSRRDEERWFKTVQQTKKILEAHGIVTSLNPWMTALHCDRGRRFPKDRRFAPMVSPSGAVSRACASFDDPRWRHYLARLYGRFARLGFRVIWIEDDFRFHNHAPLDWGGGFEPAVLARFSRAVGRKVSRAAALKAILKAGRPHPWRKIWMANWRALHLEVARGLASAVSRNMPGETRLGLMSSHPAVHSVEGRRWLRLFAALSIKGQVAHRPHYAPYGEAAGREKPYSSMMLDLQRQLRPPGAEAAPEVENFPFTAWSKPDAQTWAEMALCNFFGADALLLDLFPFSGNRPQEEPGIGRMLKKSRPGLDWIAARFTPEWQTAGVGLPWREDAAERIRLPPKANLSSLEADPFAGGFLLANYGIPVSLRPGKINALFGRLAWVFDDRQIRALLAGGLILDGESAHILQQRGFGQQLGCEISGLVEREQDSFAIEMIAQSFPGIRRGFYLNANLGACMAQIQPGRNAAEWSTLLRPDRRRFGAAMLAFRNSLGGKVVIYAAPNPAGLAASDCRRRLARQAVQFAAGGQWAAPRVAGGPYLLPIFFRHKSGAKLAIYNGGVDPVIPEVEAPRDFGRPRTTTILAPLAAPRPAGSKRLHRGRCGAWVLNQPLPHHGFAVLEWQP